MAPINRPKPIKELTEPMKRRLPPDIMSKLEALVDQELQNELDKEAEEAYKEEYKRKRKHQLRPDEELRQVYVDLPEIAADIKIDGHVYVHGCFYQVTKAVADTIKDIMFKAWHSEAERRGDKSANEYQAKLGGLLSGKGIPTDQSRENSEPKW